MGKKSKRRQGKAPQKSKVMASKTSAKSCSHGLPPADPNDFVAMNRLKVRQEAITTVVENFQQTEEFARDWSVVIMGAIKNLERRNLVDELMVSCAVSNAADCIINRHQNYRDHGFLLLYIALTMEYWIQVGGEEFESLVSDNVDPKSRRKHPWLTEYSKKLCNIVTERDLIRCLVKLIPCDCLDDAKEECKNSLKTKICFHCQRQFSKSELYFCSKCEIARYCSEECLLADWKEHRPFCKGCPRHRNKKS